MVQKCAWRCWVCASRCTGGKARSRIGKTETARPTVTRTAPGSPVFTNGFERTEDRRGEHDQHHQSYPRICIERPRGVLVGVEESDLEQQDTGAVAHASPAPGAPSMLGMLRLLAGLISGVSAASWPTRAAARCADPTSQHSDTRISRILQMWGTKRWADVTDSADHAHPGLFSVSRAISCVEAGDGHEQTRRADLRQGVAADRLGSRSRSDDLGTRPILGQPAYGNAVRPGIATGSVASAACPARSSPRGA